MRERRDGTRLDLEALTHRRVGRKVIGHHLDRHIALESHVARAIDLAHAAGSKNGDDFVLGETGTRCKGHGVR